MNPITYKDIHKVTFPVYILPNSNWASRDGLLYVDNAILDDKNMPGETLGIRRLQTPMRGLQPLRKMCNSFVGLIKEPSGRAYIDSAGKVFTYQKTKMCLLKYLRIKRIEKKTVASVIWVYGVNSPFIVPRPPAENYMWAGILHLDELPWILYDFSKIKHKDSRRKV